MNGILLLLANFAGVSFAIFLVKTSLAGNVNADWHGGAVRCDVRLATAAAAAL